MRMLSLFSGIGGIDLAAEEAGIDIVGQVEIDPYCQRVLAHHWPEVPRYGDIHQIRGDEFGAVDLIAGGFPCQGNSAAGQRRGRTDERHLWPEYARLIRAIKPRWVVGENVGGLLSIDVQPDDHGVMGDILRDLAEMGYSMGWCVLSAADVGAPHRRERVFIIAHLADPTSQRGDARRTERQGQTGNGAFVSDGTVAHTGNQRCEWHTATGWQTERWPEYSGDVAHASGDNSQRRGRDRHVGSTSPTDQGTGQEREWLRDTIDDRGANVADTRSKQRSRGGAGLSGGRDTVSESPQRGNADRCHQAMANAAGQGLQERDRGNGSTGACSVTERDTGDTGPLERRLGSSVTRFPGWLAGSPQWPAGPGQSQHDWEAPRTIAKGQDKDRVAKLKALGNAVVPAQIYPIFAAIMAYECEVA